MAVKRKRITLRRLYPKSYIEVTVWVLSSYYQNLSILWNLSLLGTWNNLNLVLKTLLFTLDLRWALCLKGGKAPYLNKFEPLSIRLSAKKYQMFRCCIRVPCCECVWLIYDMYLAIQASLGGSRCVVCGKFAAVQCTVVVHQAKGNSQQTMWTVLVSIVVSHECLFQTRCKSSSFSLLAFVVLPPGMDKVNLSISSKDMEDTLLHDTSLRRHNSPIYL